MDSYFCYSSWEIFMSDSWGSITEARRECKADCSEGLFSFRTRSLLSRKSLVLMFSYSVLL
jgi:hypothetical protein